jgi:hypothetical protein
VVIAHFLTKISGEILANFSYISILETTMKVTRRELRKIIANSINEGIFGKKGKDKNEKPEPKSSPLDEFLKEQGFDSLDQVKEEDGKIKAIGQGKSLSTEMARTMAKMDALGKILKHLGVSKLSTGVGGGNLKKIDDTIYGVFYVNKPN